VLPQLLSCCLGRPSSWLSSWQRAAAAAPYSHEETEMFEPSPQPRPQLASHDLVGKLRLQLLAATQTAAATATSADRFLAFGFSSFG